MSLLHLGSTAAADDKVYPEDVFTAYLRTGTGADVTVNTGIDMTKGYMLWSKSRSNATDHAIYDSARGVTKDLVTNSTEAETTQSTGLKSVSTTGHTIGSLAKMNTHGATYVDWIFRKAPKFFDVVTYTGNGAGDRDIAHSLGQEIGMAIFKATNASTNWFVYHRSRSGQMLRLNLTNAEAAETGWFVSAGMTSTSFRVSSGNNASGTTYVAYLFAHDPSADGIIQCGSFTLNAGGTGSVAIGFEPQYLMIKRADSVGDWWCVDTMRGLQMGTDNVLLANTSGSETSGAQNVADLTATGFNCFGISNATYVYLAIRRPMKVPTSGTQVYNAIARTGTGAVANVNGVGFAPDFVMNKRRDVALGSAFQDRLRGATVEMYPYATIAEWLGSTTLTAYTMDGITVGNNANWNGSTYPIINHFFKRAKGFMDIVCYTGTGVARTVNHNLGVVPELMIVKCRSNANDWAVYYGDNTKYLLLNSTAIPITSSAYWNNTSPTNSLLTVGTDTDVNTSAYTYVAYLFATLAGVSKVGSYTGNGTSQTINCGFTTGSRFVLVKRTDSTGDWYVWDTARGIIAANDPHLSLNTTAAEVTTDDSVDPEASGFIVNQNTATNINVLNGTYIFLAIA